MWFFLLSPSGLRKMSRSPMLGLVLSGTWVTDDMAKWFVATAWDCIYFTLDCLGSKSLRFCRLLWQVTSASLLSFHPLPVQGPTVLTSEGGCEAAVSEGTQSVQSSDGHTQAEVTIALWIWDERAGLRNETLSLVRDPWRNLHILKKMLSLHCQLVPHTQPERHRSSGTRSIVPAWGRDRAAPGPPLSASESAMTSASRSALYTGGGGI